ncbi:unnamed protein product [Leptidea sinapis]|uniref:Uncharacterized protein n=1 Tax=Leptidea sinapis TaxID=189913 RepID=A0A5E4QP96_9NEOP|nr:unnamed protein product [Leptidea sinapis]
MPSPRTALSSMPTRATHAFAHPIHTLNDALATSSYDLPTVREQDGQRFSSIRFRRTKIEITSREQNNNIYA